MVDRNGYMWKLTACISYFFPDTRGQLWTQTNSQEADYLSSLQSQQALPLALINRLQELALGLSAVVAVAVLAAALHFRLGGLLTAAVYVTACLVGNAALTGVFSGVFDRYQARVAWLLVVFAVVGGVLVARRLMTLRRAEPAGTAGPEPASLTS
jgi:hypothetical protein